MPSIVEGVYAPERLATLVTPPIDAVTLGLLLPDLNAIQMTQTIGKFYRSIMTYSLSAW